MAPGVLWFRIHPSKAETMNRRSFLWQGLCSSLPFLARSSFSQQVAGLPAAKPSDADLTALARGLTGNIFRPGDPKYEQLRKGYAAKFDEHPAFVVRPVNPQDIQAVLSSQGPIICLSLSAAEAITMPVTPPVRVASCSKCLASATSPLLLAKAMRASAAECCAA